MQRTRIGLVGWLIATAVVVSACTTADDTASGPGTTAGSAPAATPPVSAAAATAPSAPAGLDAATKTACTALDKDIKSNNAKIAKAEKIGPPAGYLAVSAQYSAGSAAFYSHMIGANAAVDGAANKVAKALSDLADAWGENPKKKPSKADLNAALKDLTTACTPT